MFPKFVTIGYWLYYATFLVYENRRGILNIHSLYNTSKFIFYITDRFGIVDAIKKKITHVNTPMILQIGGVETTELGEFEIILFD